MRQVILYQGKNGYWVVECTSLPGCISQGATEQEALANIREAIELWIEDAVEHQEPIPNDIEVRVERIGSRASLPYHDRIEARS